MTSFDLASARAFTTNLVERMDRHENDEGMECAALEAALLNYADTCRNFREVVRRWKHAIFAGMTDYDSDFDRELQAAGKRLYVHAKEMSEYGQRFERACEPLEGQTKLQLALGDLDQLLKGWVTPKLAASPAPRRWSMPNSDATDESRRLIEALPPLPADWQPDDPDQKARYRELRKS